MAAATELIFKVFWMGFLSAGKLGVDDHPSIHAWQVTFRISGAAVNGPNYDTMGARRMPPDWTLCHLQKFCTSEAMVDRRLSISMVAMI